MRSARSKGVKHPIQQQIHTQLRERGEGSWGYTLLKRAAHTKEKDKGGSVHHEEAPTDHTELDDPVEECKDIVQELSLTVEPVVEELGNEIILAKKRLGVLDIEDDEILAVFRRHKAVQGKILFEAENTNNIGVEHFGYGDVAGARGLFEKALEMVNRPRRSAANELADFKEFIASRYGGDKNALYKALASGEWGLSLSRRRFVEAMKRLGYPGDADRLFTIANSNGQTDGKLTTAELERLCKAQPLRLDEMDRDPMEKGIILSNIAACDMQQGLPIEALQKLRKAVKIIQQSGDHDLKVQRVMGNIATAYILSGAHDSALNHLSAALTQREAMQSPRDPDVLNLLYLIGYCFLVKANRFDIIHDRKRMDSRQQEHPVEVSYSLALCSFKERLRRQEATLSQDSFEGFPGGEEQLRLDIARSHEVVAEIHDQRGELDKAMLHLHSAVAHKEELLPDGDPELLNVWNVYASICIQAGQYEEALLVLERACEVSIALFGELSLSMATELFYTALVHFRIGVQQSRGDRKEAERSFKTAQSCLQRVILARTDACGEEAPEVAECLQLNGSISLALGERVAARRNFQRALLIRAKVMGSTHVSVASSAQALGCLYARTPRREQEAIFLLRKAMRIREKRLPEDSLHLADSLHELGSALLRRHASGDAEAALPLLSRAAQIREKQAGRRSLAYAASMQQVGQAHMQLELYSEARLYLQAALSLRELLVGKRSLQTAMTRFALGMSLFHLADYNLAMKQLKLSYSVREGFFGSDHPQSADSLHQIGVVYVKKNDLNAALPFLLRALDTRIKLNEAECAAREDDSDEEEAAKQRRAQRKLQEKPVQTVGAHMTKGGSRLRLAGLPLKSQSQLDVSASPSAPKSLMKSSSMNQLIKGITGSATFADSSTSTSDQAASGSVTRSLRISTPPEDDRELDIEEAGVDAEGSLAGAIGNSMQLVSVVYMDLQEFEQARYHLSRAVCIRREVFGNQSVEYGESLHIMGTFFSRQEKAPPALKYFQKALRVREKACGQMHKSIAETCTELGNILALMGESQEASLYLLRAIGIREQLFGPGDEQLHSLKEKWSALAAESMHYDPVAGGEALPHFSQRTAESYVQGQTAEAQEQQNSRQSTRQTLRQSMRQGSRQSRRSVRPSLRASIHGGPPAGIPV